MPNELETQNCRNCYNSSPRGAIYCSTCGEKLSSSSSGTLNIEPNKARPEFSASNADSKPKTPSNTMAFSIAGGITIFAVLLAGLVVYNDTLMTSDAQTDLNLSYESVKAEVESVPISPATCEKATQLVEKEPAYLFAQKNLSKSEKAAKRVTIWNADKYLAKNPWVQNSLFPYDEVPYGKFVRDLSDPLLRATLSSINSSFLDDVAGDFADNSFENFSTHIIERCGLSDAIEGNRKVVWAFDGANAKIVALAKQKPWYPKGFVEVSGYTGFAYKDSQRGCSYSFGSCATFEIVSRTGCPTNLYVQTNLLSGGTVVDWSNDTAIVRAGQIAFMETTFTQGSGGTWDFAKISCY